MKTRTKISALLLAILMIVAVLPISVSAAEPSATDVAAIYGSDGVCKAGYATFKDAWSAAVTGDTVKLLANCTVSETKTGFTFKSSRTEVTVDLNGYVLKSTDSQRMFYLGEGYELTIKDSRPTAEHWYDASSTLYVWDDEPANRDDDYVMIPGGAITGCYSGTEDETEGTFKDSQGSGKGGVFCIKYNSTLNIEGGNFIGNRCQNHGTVVYLRHSSSKGSAVFNMSGGLFLGNKSDYGHHNDITTETMDESSSVTGGVFWYDTENARFDFANTIESGYEVVSVTMYGKNLYTVTDTTSVQFLGVQRTAAESGEYSLRLIAQVKADLIDEAATSASFNIAVNDGTAKAHAVSCYYTSLTAQGANGEATAITPDAEYVLLAVIINNIPVENASKLTVGVSLTEPNKATAKNVEIQLVANGNPTVAYVASGS